MLRAQVNRTYGVLSGKTALLAGAPWTCSTVEGWRERRSGARELAAGAHAPHTARTNPRNPRNLDIKAGETAYQTVLVSKSASQTRTAQVLYRICLGVKDEFH